MPEQKSSSHPPELIILAGGFGTRLREVTDLPKCMAPVAGRPFLFYVINYFRSQGIRRFIFTLGYKHELVENYLAEEFPTLDYTCSIEKEPLGTGGALKLSLSLSGGKTVLAANGDTLYRIGVDKFIDEHFKSNADCSLALKPMEETGRYGLVELDDQGWIREFREKQVGQSGLINGGIYLIETNKFIARDLPEKFSFEKDYLEKMKRGLKGYVDDGYFIDIGIPGDFQRAQEEFDRPELDLSQVDKTWTIFIDRDGVINHEKKEDYILHPGEFRFYEGVPGAIKKLGDRFGKLIIVSNQRGVGRQLMKESALLDIHDHMLKELRQSGGRVDDILYCTATDNKDPDRKPNPGMAFRAARKEPLIRLDKSIMVGNKLSDMRFGRNAGMYTVFIASTNPETPYPHPDIDLRFNSLPDLAKAL